MLVFREGTGNDLPIPPGVIIAIEGFKASECWCIFCPKKKHAKKHQEISVNCMAWIYTSRPQKQSPPSILLHGFRVLEIFILDLFKMLGKRKYILPNGGERW